MFKKLSRLKKYLPVKTVLRKNNCEIKNKMHWSFKMGTDKLKSSRIC